MYLLFCLAAYWNYMVFGSVIYWIYQCWVICACFSIVLCILWFTLLYTCVPYCRIFMSYIWKINKKLTLKKTSSNGTHDKSIKHPMCFHVCISTCFCLLFIWDWCCWKLNIHCGNCGKKQFCKYLPKFNMKWALRLVYSPRIMCIIGETWDLSGLRI